MSEEDTSRGPSLGDRILDTLIGLWTLLLVLPLWPFLLLAWLWDRFKGDDEYDRDREFRS